MFLYKSATSAEKSTEPTLVTKHGSHNQKTHAGSRGGGGGGSSEAKPKRTVGDRIERKRNDEKVNVLSGRVKVLSASLRPANPMAADKLKSIEAKLQMAGKSSTDSKRHYDLVQQSLGGLNKIRNKNLSQFENAGQAGNLKTTLGQLNDYFMDMNDEVTGFYNLLPNPQI